MKSIIPRHYQSKLNVLETQHAIKLIKDTFERKLSEKLNLIRVSAPLFVHPKTGLNDNLTGREKAVSFIVKDINEEIEIVHSLAKWKRMALQKYGLSLYEGLYTDMNAIRVEESLDNLHSIYVDQWDWEKIITQEDRTIDYLQSIVRLINDAIVETLEIVKQRFTKITIDLLKDVFFITSEELYQLYPHLTAKERENAICKEKKTVFIMQIGKKLSNDLPHDLRAPDYDDWELNGDLLVWYPLLDCAIELSSMGIRVDKDSLIRQLTEVKSLDKLHLSYHQDVLNDRLPLTIGGGIGQSRLCMVMLEKAHIGEVQVSIWDEEEVEKLRKYNIFLL